MASRWRSPTRARARRSCCCTAFPTRPGCGATRSRRSSRRASASSRPTCAASASPTSRTAVEDYAILHSVADVVAVLDALGDRARARRRARLGRGARVGARRVRRPSVSTTSSRCRSGIRRRCASGRSRSARSRGTCCCSSSRASPRSCCARDDWTLMREFAARRRRHRAVRRRPLAARRADRGAELVPRERPAGARARAVPPFPPVAAPTLGHLEQRRRLPDRGADARAPASTSTAPWRYERIEGASHWMQLDAPERVNELLLEFLV